LDPEASKEQPPPLHEEVNDAVGAWFAGGEAMKNNDLFVQSTPPVPGPFTNVAGPDTTPPVKSTLYMLLSVLFTKYKVLPDTNMPPALLKSTLLETGVSVLSTIPLSGVNQAEYNVGLPLIVKYSFPAL
jgi:hypothetical protein